MLSDVKSAPGMIVVRFTSGLGNQMYQYNLYRYLEEKYPEVRVKADLTWFYANNDHHGFELKRIFEGVSGSQFHLSEATLGEIYRCSGQIPVPIKGSLAKSARFLLGPVNRKLREAGKPEKCGVTYDQLEGDIPFEAIDGIDTGRNYYIGGFFIEEHYYKDRVARLKRELIFPQVAKDDKANLQMLEDIGKSDSVSVHVRRGDYLSSTYSGQFVALGQEYYRNAVGYIKEKIAEPKFFIFSDDPEYIREAFSWLDNKVIVDINSGDNSFRDMQLMANCKHNIIANSTFSQWAAILNDNAGHITVYPQKYLTYEDSEEKTMEGWIRL